MKGFSMYIVKADGIIKSYNHGITNKISGEKEYKVLKGIDLKKNILYQIFAI